MEQPQEEAPEAREEEKEEVATTEGASELNGGPGHVLPSGSCTGAEETEGLRGQASRVEVQASVGSLGWGTEEWSEVINASILGPAMPLTGPSGNRRDGRPSGCELW